MLMDHGPSSTLGGPEKSRCIAVLFQVEVRSLGADVRVSRNPHPQGINVRLADLQPSVSGVSVKCQFQRLGLGFLLVDLHVGLGGQGVMVIISVIGCVRLSDDPDLILIPVVFLDVNSCHGVSLLGLGLCAKRLRRRPPRDGRYRKS